jgi:hypothetical protein
MAGRIKTVQDEVRQAYLDCWSHRDFMEVESLRNLQFRASDFVSRDEAVAILSDVMDGYNNFEPKLLLKLPEDCKVVIAREGSVCVYVDCKVSGKLARSMKVDENNFVDEERPYAAAIPGYSTVGLTRLWWD